MATESSNTKVQLIEISSDFVTISTIEISDQQTKESNSKMHSQN